MLRTIQYVPPFWVQKPLRQIDMLILTRKLGEAIAIGDDIWVTVVDIQGRQIRLGIDAPKSLPVYRAEIYERIKTENQRAASAPPSHLKDLATQWKQHRPDTSYRE